MFYTYILYSKTIDSYYVGYTGMEVEQRLKKHLTNHKGYTSKAKDWIIIYKEEYVFKQDALRRELEIKAWKSRRRIEQLMSKK